jgi:enoyl-[acyl-carrier protein] reductase/trans-2-enoyl-CoA reductase (NAD+)
MYALSAQILKERGQYKDLPEMAFDSMEIFRPGWDGGEVRLDAAYQASLPEFHRRKDALAAGDVPAAFSALYR